MIEPPRARRLDRDHASVGGTRTGGNAGLLRPVDDPDFHIGFDVDLAREPDVRRQVALARQPLLLGLAHGRDAAVEHLEELVQLDLWLVTPVRDGPQTVVASAGAWSSSRLQGATYAWEDSFCLRMVERRGPVVAPDVAAVPAYAEAAVGPLEAVRAYVGVPLEGDDGVVFGTLCGFDGEPQDAGWDGSLSSVRL